MRGDAPTDVRHERKVPYDGRVATDPPNEPDERSGARHKIVTYGLNWTTFPHPRRPVCSASPFVSTHSPSEPSCVPIPLRPADHETSAF